jgi:hydrogenase large subunit
MPGAPAPWCAAFEIILKGRDPRDAWAFTERVCGVCTTVHALASVRSVEDALGIKIPPNAELIRNLMFCAQYMQDHVVHFYHLHALDWVDVVSALKADPAETSRIAQSISHWPKSSPGLFSDLQKRLTKFRGERPARHLRQRLLGPPGLQAAARGQPDRRRALPRGARVAEGDRQGPHDLRRQESASELPRRRRALLDQHRRGQRHQRRAARHGRPLFEEGQRFIEQVYIPDLLAVAPFYLDWDGIGGGWRIISATATCRPTASPTSRSFKFPRGADPRPRPLSRCTRSIRTTPTACRNSSTTRGIPTRTAPPGAAPVGRRDEVQLHRPEAAVREPQRRRQILWLKTPRWKGHAMEVGPLARMLVGYAPAATPRSRRPCRRRSAR